MLLFDVLASGRGGSGMCCNFLKIILIGQFWLESEHQLSQD